MTGGDDDPVTPRTAEQWAMLCALKIEQDHADHGPVYIAEMIGRFALDGNHSGVDTSKAIARAYDPLMRALRSRLAPLGTRPLLFPVGLEV